MKTTYFSFLLLLIAFASLGQTNITGMEYFIDDDPGLGNATPIGITSGPLVSESVSIPTTGLTEGIHFLYIRVQDENGIWSVPEKRAFSIQVPITPPQPTAINAIEYFIDDDPGTGNATALSFTPGATVSINESIDVSSISPGLHFIYIRSQDDLGIWGVAERRAFRINAPVAPSQKRIVAIEYFFDTDPGINSGQQISVTPVSSLSLDTLLNTSSLALGPHTLGIRVLDERGRWSPTEISSVTICDGPNPNFSIDLNCIGLTTNFTDNSVDVVAGDIYRWDFDGDGNFDDFTNGSTSFTYAAAGTYNVQLQIEPVSGCIGNFFQQIEVFDIPVVSFSGADGCVGDPVSFTDLSTPGAATPLYEWDFDGDAIIDSNTQGDVQFTYTAPGTYDVSLRITTGLGCTDIQTSQITIDEVPAAPQGDNVSVFAGESATLQVSGGVEGRYRWYDGNSNLIPGETGSSFITPILSTSIQYSVSVVSENAICESSRTFIGANIRNPEIVIYNVVTVNPNGKHDFLKILNIDQFPGNKVTIYNRWGDRIFEIEDYNNQDRVFLGLDESGNELPDGNYFYVIDKNDGSQKENGYLYLRR